MEQNKTGKYLKYAIGEIVLVVIGILIALSINNWNGDRKERQKELSFLTQLKAEINSNLIGIKSRDSLSTINISLSEEALEKFYQVKTVQDLLTVNEMFRSQWYDLRFTTSTYDEMINTGSIYTLKNKNLQKQISDYYTFVEAWQSVIEKINNVNSELLFQNPNLAPYSYLTQHYEQDWFDIKKIDISWINDPNSPTYLALDRFYTFSQESNKDRQQIFQITLKQGQGLITEIEKELEERQ